MVAATADRPAPPLRLRLLGDFQLAHDGAEVAVTSAGQRLLALLALCRRPVRRGAVAGSLWQGSDEAHALASLRSALHRLPRPAGALVLARNDTLVLRGDVEVDLHARCALATRLHDGSGTVSEAVIPSLLTDVLPDWYDDWVVLDRESYRQVRLHALEELCRSLRREGRYAAALRAGLAAVSAEPLRESAHRVLIETHLREGNVGEAVRQYRICHDHLARGLGLAPSRSLQELVFGSAR